MQKLTDGQLGIGLSSDYQQLDERDVDDPRVDAEVFEKGIKRQFGELKRNFRDVVDNIRTNDYNSFVKVNEAKAK